ncbi:hypothetical protein QYE76_020175 [Lolium multiflorum]|uniref:Uncharacterized protein n=1 Tax=Lolium multiflorum TaxID=4521 RepID=A0AAD8VRX9_LOLMU|nr:hypothetical protein QYE76_020175 [Lolium multiflorum]
MLNSGSMTFMLRPGRMYPPHDSHESVRWNAGWFYEKNASVSEIHDGLPKFNNEPPEELASWSFVPSLALTPILEKAARRISWLVHDGLTGTQLTLSWFTRRIQPLRSLLWRRKTCAPYFVSPSVATRRRFRVTKRRKRSRHPQGPRPSSVPAPKLPARGRSQRRGLRQEAQNHQAPPLDSRKAERERLKMLTTAGKRSRPIIPGAHVQGQGEAEVTSSEKVGAGAGDVVVFPKNFGDPADLTSTPKAYATKFFNKLTEAEKWELEQDLLNAMLNNAWGKPDAATSEIQEFKKDVGQFFDKLICKQKVLPSASSSLATTSSELENLRSSYHELETKLMEAEQKKEQVEKQLAEKNSELIREKGEFLLKRNADSETIKRQQKELNGLRKYMETAEHHWDLLAENILEPLGYPERRRNKFPWDDVLSLAGDDCKDLISASRKICHNLSLKKSRTCGLRKLVKKMDILPELVTDLQASSARGAAAMTLTMCLAHNRNGS